MRFDELPYIRGIDEILKEWFFVEDISEVNWLDSLGVDIKTRREDLARQKDEARKAAEEKMKEN